MFVVPMCAMTVLYVLIALSVRRSGSCPGTPAATAQTVAEPQEMMSMASYRRATSRRARSERVETHPSQRQVSSRRTITRLLGMMMIIIMIFVVVVVAVVVVVE